MPTSSTIPQIMPGVFSIIAIIGFGAGIFNYLANASFYKLFRFVKVGVAVTAEMRAGVVGADEVRQGGIIEEEQQVKVAFQ